MTTLSRFRTFAAASFSLLALAACAGSDDPAGPVTPANGTLTVTVFAVSPGAKPSVPLAAT